MLKKHSGVYGVILRGTQILLIKKGRGPYIGKLDLPGGRQHKDELTFDCLKREVLEETGVVVLDASNAYELESSFFIEQNGISIEILHYGTIFQITECDSTGILSKINHEDSLGAEWVDYQTIARDSLTPFAQMVIKKLKSGG